MAIDVETDQVRILPGQQTVQSLADQFAVHIQGAHVVDDGHHGNAVPLGLRQQVSEQGRFAERLTCRTGNAR